MHEVEAVLRVDVEIAVVAEIHARENRFSLLFRGIVVAARAVKMVDRGQCERNVAAQFIALCVQQHVFENLSLLAIEALGFEDEQAADCSDREQQRRDGKQQNFRLEFHALDCCPAPPALSLPR